MQIPFAGFDPDKAPVARGLSLALNVIPTPGGYRPFPSPQDFSSNALTAACQGGAGFVQSDGTVHFFAGDATKLYVLAGGNTTFSDVSIAGGYNTASDGRWSFAVYGDRVMATNNAEEIQSYVMGSSTKFANLQAAAPDCKYLAVAKNFVFAANTETGPDYVQWCAQGDPTDWPTPGSADAISKLSDRVQLAGNGGAIMGIFAGLNGADLLILQERQLVRGVFVGGDQVWQFDIMEGARGCQSAGSAVPYGGVVYYWAPDGFQVTDGAVSKPIGTGQIDWFWNNDKVYGLDVDNDHLISGTVVPDYKCILWAYPSVTSATGVVDKVLAFNYETGQFSVVSGLGTVEVMARTYSPGYTLDQLDAFGNMDTLPYSLDSRYWSGGIETAGMFDSTHTFQAFNGSNLAATLITKEFEAGGGYRTQVNACRPLIEGGVNPSTTITVTPIGRETPDVSTTAGTAVTMNARGVARFRSTHRYHRFQVDVASGGTWEQAIGVDVPDDEIVIRGVR